MKRRVTAWLPAPLRSRWERLQSTPLGARLARGAFWSVAGGVVSRALNLLASIVIARLLQKEVFGELGIIQSTVGMLGVFAGFGMGLTATKHVAEYRIKDPGKAGRIIALANAVTWSTCLLFSALLFLSAPWLAQRTFSATHLAPVVQLAAGMLLLGGVNGAQTGVLAGFEAFRTVARLNLVSGLAAFPLLSLGAWWGGLRGCVWGFILSMGLQCVLSEIAIRRQAKESGVPLSWGWTREEWPILWNFTIPSVFAISLVGPVHWLCATLLVNAPNGYSEMGGFNAANQFFTALMFLPTLLGQSVLPMMAEQLGTDAKDQARRLLLLSIKVNSLVAVPVLVLALVSPFIMGLFGAGFRGEWPTLVVVLATAALLAVQAPVGHILVASGRIWTGFIMNLGWAVVYLVLTHTAIGWGWGALGLATARLVAYSAHAIWTMWYAFRILRTRVDGSAHA